MAVSFADLEPMRLLPVQADDKLAMHKYLLSSADMGVHATAVAALRNSIVSR